MSIGLEFTLQGAEHLAKLATTTHGMKRVAEVSWHAGAKYLTHYIRNHIYSAATAPDLQGVSRSLPGGYPKSQTGNLASSIGYTIHGWQGFEVYSDVSYAGYLESGTSKMAARPYLKTGIEANMMKLEQILLTNLMRAMRV